MSLDKITPNHIEKLIRFKKGDNSWKYNEIEKDMYSYQTEGVAGILNRLNRYKMAVLADEVGMGKTYQALGVVAHQFKEKSDSRVLIITPGDEVLEQWRKEYVNFREYPFKGTNKLPKNTDILTHYNEYQFKKLFDKNEEKNTFIAFSKTTTFSQTGTIKIDDVKVYFDKFDLIIVDESHQYRNDNDRTRNSFKIFSKLNDTKILLMTATPLHTREDDFLNMVSVFKSSSNDTFTINKESNSNKETKRVMYLLMIRRLRCMKKNCNKYNYRREIPIKTDLKSDNNNHKDELFFAMLQRQLINSNSKINYSKSKHLLDLLEGTTFDKKYNLNDLDENKKKKYDKDKLLEDNESLKKIFQSVVNPFYEAYNECPTNQKYTKVLEEIDNVKDYSKALVFVRRRATAIELSRQYIENFDKKAWAILSKGSFPSRENFDKVLGLNKIKEHNIDFLQDDKDFIKKYRKTMGLARKHESTVLEIMADHYYSKYEDNDKLEEFKQYIENLKDENENENQGTTSQVLGFFKYEKGSSTEAVKFIRKFYKDGSYKNFFTEWLPKKLGYKQKEHEDKFEIIQSAVLHASIGVVELFKCYIDAKTTTKTYKSFCDQVSKKIKNKNLYFIEEIKQFLDSYEEFEKNVKLDTGGDTTKDINSLFSNAQPSYAYFAGKKSPRALSRFNSPFFPYLLCGTSTLQVGLNLHVNCNRVYHFGSAHSMGDDEQRTGRVDRYGGKMQKELESSEGVNSNLHIYYPYLKNTFDEENLRSMLCHKRRTEKEIDRCNIPSNSDIETKDFKCDELKFYNPDNNTNDSDDEPFGWEMKSGHKDVSSK